MSQSRNLIGQEFGLLKVEERTNQRENRYIVWRCTCKCGGEALVNTKRLLRGTITDCGCVKKTSAKRGTIAEDLTGRQFGEWEVLYRSKNKGGKVMWVCRCSCGSIQTIAAHALKNGRTRSCRNTVHANLFWRRDLTGQTIGSLKVLHPQEQRDYKGSVMWHCQCMSCGREKDISEDALVHGGYKSCGCKQYAHSKELAKRLHYYKGTTLEALRLDGTPRPDNQLGVAGVSKTKRGMYRTSIGFQRKRYNLGTYRTIEEAKRAYESAKQDLHGRFVKAYRTWMESNQEQELFFDVTFEKGEFQIYSNY